VEQLGASERTPPDSSNHGERGRNPSRLPWTQCVVPIAAATKDFASDCLLGEFQPIRSFRRGADRGGHGAPDADMALACDLSRGNGRHYGGRGASEWTSAAQVCLAGLPSSRAGVIEWTGLVIAASLGMILAALLVLLLATASVSEAEVKRVDPSHYAAPAESRPDRTSAIGFIRVVAWEPE